MKVHITLKPTVREDPDARDAVVKAIVELSGAPPPNPKRLQKFGIATVDLDEDLVKKVRELDGVQAVEPDEEKSAI